MCGLKRYDVGFGITNIRERKKPCLFVDHGNHSFKVGQFNDMETAKDFMMILDYVYFGNNEDEVRRIIAEWEEKNNRK